MKQIRKTKTEEKIRHALSKLLLEKGLDSLTVSDITREAGINRGTFYAHYTDKFDLVQKQTDAEIAELEKLLMNETTPFEATDELIPKANVLAALRYVKDNRELVDALTDRGRDARLQERLKDLLGELLESRAKAYGSGSIDYHGIPPIYGREIVLSSVTSLIWLWVRRGCAESPEELCDIIYMNKDLSPASLLISNQ